jgi:glyoxylase-like metal-dependent hydrolase (beta-lactamase superfamily II)
VGALATWPGAPISSLVLTIDHLDHTGSIPEDCAEVIAHGLCGVVVSRRSADGQPLVTRLLESDEEVFDLDGVAVRVLHLGPSQGTGNLALHFPAQRALFVVGPRADVRYGLLSDFHFRHVSHVWRELAAIDVDVVLPGRGPRMDSAALNRAADYIDAVAEASQRAFADGLPIWVYDAMEPYISDRLRQRFGDLDGFDRHVGIASMRLVHYYLMGGWGLEDTAKPPAQPPILHY